MPSKCLNVELLDTRIFNDVCIASNILSNETAWSMAKDAFKACGGPSNFFVTADNCYTYCNITTPFDIAMMTNCFVDSMAPNFDWSQMQWDCYPFAWQSSTDTNAGLIATTWTYPDLTVEYTQSNGVLATETVDFWGTPLTAATTSSATAKASPTPTGSTATKTTGSKLSSSTGTSTTPASTASTSSTKSSGARKEFKLSYGAGALAAFSVLALVL